MIKVIGLSMLVTIALLPLSSEVQAMELNIAPKESKVLTNNSLWTLNATCTIQTNQASQKLVVNAIKNESHVNGEKLHCGQKKSIQVRNHEHLSVSAEPGAEVNIVNQGSGAILATCST